MFDLASFHPRFTRILLVFHAAALFTLCAKWIVCIAISTCSLQCLVSLSIKTVLLFQIVIILAFRKLSLSTNCIEKIANLNGLSKFKYYMKVF